MKIGYPCINESLTCRSSRTFRLHSYSETLIQSKIRENLTCLSEILHWNVRNNIFFFRISSDLIPFASHPVNKFPWYKEFYRELSEIGSFINKNSIRVSMHPDQFVLINAQKPEIVHKSIAELEYHAKVLDLLGSDHSAKIQIHVGGVYGNKPDAIRRFCEEYKKLSKRVKKRLVIENDERLFSVKDVLTIHETTSVPVLIDVFHHSLYNNNESLSSIFTLVQATWKKEDGLPIIDFSTQKPAARSGSHALHLDTEYFRDFLKQTTAFDFDIMLEIKDKEKSAVKAIKIAKNDPRIFRR